MSEKRKKLTIVVAIIVMLAICIIVPTFALLIHSTNIDNSIQFGEIPQDSTEFTADTLQTFSFAQAGATHDIDLNIKNLADKPMRYSLQIELDGATQGLENAIFVHFDGEYAGTLAKAKTQPLVMDNSNFILKATANGVNDNVRHKLSLELHNGAQGSLYDGKTFQAKITLSARTINYQQEILVSTTQEWNNAIGDVNYATAYKTIRLVNDIALDSDVVISKGCTIDLMGSQLMFANKTLTIAQSALGVVDIISSRGVVGTQQVSGIVLDSANASVRFDDNASSYSALVDIVECHQQSAYNMVMASVKDVLGKGIMSEQSVKIATGLEHYIDNGTIAITRANGEYALNNLAVTANAMTRTAMATIVIDNQPLEFKTLGNDVDGYSAIIAQELEHLYNASMGTAQEEIDYDLYLPLYLPRVNAYIEWTSMNPEIMTSQGKCQEAVEGLVTIQAVITINGTVIVENFDFSVLKQTNQMRFDYLIARIGEPTLSALYDLSVPKGSQVILPIVDQTSTDDYRVMYNLRSLGLDSLKYSLPAQYDFVSTLGTPNRVHLTNYTLEEYAYVKVTGVFANELGVQYESVISIKIETVDNQKLHSMIIDYVQNLADQVDILGNILDTRAQDGMVNERGDFELPTSYRGYKLVYKDGADGIFAGGIADMLEEDKCSLSPIIDRFKTADSRTYIELTITKEEWDEAQITTIDKIYLDIPGILRNGSDSISSNGLFYNIKLLAVQQLQNADGTLQTGVPRVESNGNTSSMETNISAVQGWLNKNYLLLRDLEYMRKFVLTKGDYWVNNPQGVYKLDSASGLYTIHVNHIYELSVGMYKITDLKFFTVDGSAPSKDTNMIFKTAGLGDKYFDFASGSFPNIEYFQMKLVDLAKVSNIIKLDKATHIDMSQNPRIGSWSFINERRNHRLDYLDIRNTGERADITEGMLAGLWYKHTVMAGLYQPEFYYDSGNVGQRYISTSTAEQLYAQYILYTISLGVDVLKARQMTFNAYALAPNGTRVDVEWQYSEFDIYPNAIITVPKPNNYKIYQLNNKLFKTEQGNNPDIVPIVLHVNRWYIEASTGLWTMQSRKIMFYIAYR